MGDQKLALNAILTFRLFQDDVDGFQFFHRIGGNFFEGGGLHTLPP